MSFGCSDARAENRFRSARRIIISDRASTHHRVSRATGLTSSDAVPASIWLCSSFDRSSTSRPPGTWSNASSHGTFVDSNRPAIRHCMWSTCCSDTPSSNPFDHLARISPECSSASVSYCSGTPAANPRKSRPNSCTCPRQLLSGPRPLGTT